MTIAEKFAMDPPEVKMPMVWIESNVVSVVLSGFVNAERALAFDESVENTTKRWMDRYEIVA